VVITVVLPAHNPSAEELDTAIRSVRAHLPGSEVIVVDDGSVEPVSTPLADVVTRTTGLGPSGARNHGAAQASGQWLLFLDDDDVLLDGAAQFVTAVSDVDGECDLVCAPAVVDRGGTTTIQQPTECPGLSGAPELSSLAGSFAVRRDLFDRIGGYDAELHFGENTDLIIRCAALSRVRRIDVPTVVYWAESNESRYDERRLRSVVRVLDRGRADLHDPVVRSQLHGIAAVNASRLGLYRTSIRHALRSFTAKPTVRALVRLVASFSGPVVARWWRRGRS
jgi:glycosyltransferase involved in cell wall biosynthesis